MRVSTNALECDLARPTAKLNFWYYREIFLSPSPSQSHSAETPTSVGLRVINEKFWVISIFCDPTTCRFWSKKCQASSKFELWWALIYRTNAFKQKENARGIAKTFWIVRGDSGAPKQLIPKVWFLPGFRSLYCENIGNIKLVSIKKLSKSRLLRRRILQNFGPWGDAPHLSPPAATPMRNVHLRCIYMRRYYKSATSAPFHHEDGSD